MNTAEQGSAGNQECAVLMENAEKRFGQRTAVAGISLSIPCGSLCGFIGPNGSGKTTTLRMILRIVRPDQGRVVVLGAESGDCADNRVGYLPEERGLYRRMRVRELLRYYAALKGVRNPDPEISRWLLRLQADGWDQRRIDGLSKGMCQKIQFIAAVIARPRLLILDEPFSGLDPVNLELLRGAIEELQREGTSIILSTHEMETAQRMCERVVMIYRGQKVLDGVVSEILARAAKPFLKIRTASGQVLPEGLPGVVSVQQQGLYQQLQLSGELGVSELVRRLSAMAELEHFELVQPSLHEVFLSLVSRDVSEPAAMPATKAAGAGDCRPTSRAGWAWQSVRRLLSPLGSAGH